MDPLDPVSALQRLGGVSDGTTLHRACDPWELRVAVSEGRVVHLGHNSYALPGADEARTAAKRLHGVASHLSAAHAWGWKVKRLPTRPVVTVPRHRTVDAERRAGTDVHHADLPGRGCGGRLHLAGADRHRLRPDLALRRGAHRR